MIGKNDWISFDYVNWKGEAGKRTVVVNGIYFGQNEWHKEAQWLMRAWDLEKDSFREFAMKDMSNVQIV